MDNQDVKSWIGRSEEQTDTLLTQQATLMQATLGEEQNLKTGDPLPPLWHWIYFLTAKPIQDLGRDGHPKKGGFLPPVSLPRRMWAGGRFTFISPILLGGEVTKRSTIKNIQHKSGRSGELCFVTVQHELIQQGEVAIIEEHDIVYREDPKPDAPKPTPKTAPNDADVTELITPSQVMLFRYSALTFNGHRIHYDVDYAKQVEGYDGLVFHGPLTATLLVNLATKTFGKTPKTFEFKGLSPIAGMDKFHIEGNRDGDNMQLWARRRDGALAMTATATF